MPIFNDNRDQELINWARLGNIGTVRDLLAAGANINATTSGGLSALHLAAAGGHWEVIEELLLVSRPGANVNLVADGGRTPLMSAMQSCNEKVVALLLINGAEVNAADREGWTALHHAAVKGRRGIIDLLLNAGADFMLKDQMGRTPAAIAKEKSAAAELLAEKEKKFLLEKYRKEQEALSTQNINKLDRIRPRKKRPSEN